MGQAYDPVDCLVVSGGPAGLSAAIYLARYRRKVLVIDGGDSRALLIPESHKYPGFSGIAGQELLARLHEQAQKYGAIFQENEVKSVCRSSAGWFRATCPTGDLQALSVILTTGLTDETPPVGGITDPGAGGLIRYCPICDGYEAKDKRIGVLGPLAVAGKEGSLSAQLKGCLAVCN